MSFSGPGGRTKKATVSVNQTKGRLNYASAEALPIDAHHVFLPFCFRVAGFKPVSAM